MTIVHEQAAKEAATDAVVDLVDGGTGAGHLDICAGATVLIALTLNNPAFGDASAAGTATLLQSPAISGTATDTGTADNFKLYDGDDTLILTGSVGTSGEDMNVDNTAITTGQTVAVTSFTYDSAEA